MDKHYELQTPFGVAWIFVTQKNHLCVDANHNCLSDNIAPYPEGSRMGPLTINGVEIGAHAHMYLWNDGKWHVGPEFTKDHGELKLATDYERRMSLHMGKIHSKNYNDIPSESARTKLAALLPALVTEWANQHQNVICQAEVEHLQDELDKAREALHDATELAKQAAKRVSETETALQVAEAKLRCQDTVAAS